MEITENNKIEKISWKSEKRKLVDLKNWEGNPRGAGEKDKEDLTNSLDKFGLAAPIIINTDNTIIGGHFRIRVLKEKGVEDVDVRVPERKLTEQEVSELNLRLNKNLGKWDYDMLANFDEKELLGVGFGSEELDKIFQLDTQEEDEIPDLPDEPISKLGDIYQLGKHRLMCGDATKKEDVEKLMDGKKAGMVFTDPPYNVDYGVSKKLRHEVRTIENDKQSDSEWKDFNYSFIQNIIDFYKGGDIYIWGASSPEGMKQRLWLNDIGFHWSATIVWKKQQLVLSPAKYQRMYEPCFYGWLEKSTYRGGRKQTEVWEIDRPLNSKLHPTMKPVELCTRAIKNSSEREEIVLDLFGGSGSTLIAAEQSNRKCYMMELDAKYIDVIIKRWETLTNKKAQLLK